MKQAWHTPVCMVLGLATAILVASVARETSSHIDILSNELADGQIVEGLRRDALFGQFGQPSLGNTRLRLPMYLESVWGWCFGWQEGVPTRGLSAFVGIVTVVATAALACSLFGLGTGLLSALILSISPYFLAYSGLAWTEGDVFASCFVTLAMGSYVSYLRTPSPVRWLLSAALFGCAVGTTIFAAYLIVVFWLLSATTYSEPSFKLSRMPNHTRRLHRLLAWQVIVICATACIAILCRFPPKQFDLGWLLPHARTAAIAGWVVSLALWVGTGVFVIVMGVLSRSREERFWAFAAFAFCTVFAIMPVHLLDPSIAREIIVRTGTWDGGFPFCRLSDHLRLYSGIILLKMTMPLGLVTMLSLVYGAFSERNDGRWRPCVWAILLFIALLCTLPSRQSRNLMAVYPMLAIVTSAGLAGITRRVRDLRSGPISTIWLLGATAAVLYLGRESWMSRASHSHYGAELLGSRFDWKWLGAESRGNRNLIHTSADGVESLIEWCESSDDVRAGSRVVSYLWDESIVNSLLPARTRYTFVPRGVSTETGEILSPPAIHNADFVLLHITNFVGYDDGPPDLPPMDELKDRFEPIFTVRRGGMEIAWIYGRKR